MKSDRWLWPIINRPRLHAAILSVFILAMIFSASAAAGSSSGGELASALVALLSWSLSFVASALTLHSSMGRMATWNAVSARPADFSLLAIEYHDEWIAVPVARTERRR